jgi:predicted O-methyltransferase YrrM
MAEYVALPKTQDETWSAVDEYFSDKLVRPDAVLDAALVANRAAGLPEIDVAPNQGKFLHLLARMQKASRILEIGTLGGYSTIWLALALEPGGQMISMEFEPKHAKVARENIARAKLSDRVEVRVGAALDSLAALEKEKPAPFDFIFIDADKPNNPHYLTWALAFSRVGTVILCDNVVRDGAILDANHPDPRVTGTREMFDVMSKEPRLVATALQTVGSKGYDGFAMGLVVNL